MYFSTRYKHGAGTVHVVSFLRFVRLQSIDLSTRRLVQQVVLITARAEFSNTFCGAAADISIVRTNRALVSRALLRTRALEKVFGRAACKVLHTRATYTIPRLDRPSFTYIVLFFIIIFFISARRRVRATDTAGKKNTHTNNIIAVFFFLFLRPGCPT